MMVRLQFAVIFFFGWVSHTLAAICPCVEEKIWYPHGLGLTPDIVQIQAMVANAGTPNRYTACLPTFDMINNKGALNDFYSLHSTVFVAPQTGTYTFYMACDNTCVLALDGVDILWLYEYTPNYVYTTYPANQTTTYTLTEGQCLNITVIQADGDKADHVTIKVMYPDGTVDSPMSKHICDKCPCDDYNPCIHGTCITTGDAPDGFHCDCLDCYKGANCSTVNDSACYPNPCEHGGTCIPTGANDDCYECDCPPCYTGKNCSEEINNCDHDTCKNGGTCTFDPQDASCYACDCPECFEGDNCEIEINPCDSNPCLNGGTCHPDPTVPGCYYCECTKCFLGSKNCETPVDNCHPDNPCLNDGNCTFLNDDDKCYECSCTPCWEGDNCEKQINPCESNPCLHGGTCHPDSTKPDCYYCECTPCWEGDNCEKPKDYCKPNPCYDGTCSWVDDGKYCYYCDCTECYKGRICDIPVVKCNPNPCENGGTCKFKNDSDCYECVCTPCWTGTNCTIKKNKCKPDPCQNGGTCSWVDDKDKCYKCKCPVCYDGENCQNEVDNCKPNPCKNGGTCKFVNDSKLCYKCDCAPCWTGPTCEDETKCWLKYGVQCQEANCKTPPEEDVKNHCPNNCKCCVEPGCYDTGKNCLQRCQNINAGNVGLLSKECRRSCDFCCPCEGKCDLMFQKKGCWRDKIKRKLGTLVLNERSTPLNWAGWNNYLPYFVCRCAKAAAKAGFRFFGVQFYRECWAGNNWFYDSSGNCTSRNKPCIDREWHECTWPDRQEEQETPPLYCCAGKNDCNYVYEIPVNQKVDPCHLLE